MDAALLYNSFTIGFFAEFIIRLAFYALFGKVLFFWCIWSTWSLHSHLCYPCVSYLFAGHLCDAPRRFALLAAHQFRAGCFCSCQVLWAHILFLRAHAVELLRIF